MAMLPVLLEIVDQMYNSLDSQSQTFQDGGIPMLFVPQQRPASGCGQRRMQFRCRPAGSFPGEAGCGRKCPRGNCARKAASDDFQVSVDVKSFNPEEINVKVKDREIIVEGKHEERQDETGFVSRQFTRRFVLPQEFDPDTISTFLNAEGKMTIKAVKPQPAAVETNERVIPIQRVPTEAAEATEAPATEQEWEKVDEAAGAEKPIKE